MAFPYSFHGASSVYIPTTTVPSAWYRYEAARSFDLDDDLEFCPELLSEDEVHYINVTAYSDRSSSTSGSPNSSPLQMQIQPSSATTTSLQPINSTSPFNPNLKMQQSSSARQRNAIPIVNPHTGMRVPSPPLLSANSSNSVHSGQSPRRHW